MASVPAVGTPSSASSSSKGSKGLADVDLDQFLKLLITELQNQDPMNPMDNAQMLEQISQIRQIGSTTKLTDTLSGLASGQDLSMASGMIGKTVTALDVGGKNIKGVVERVSVQTDAIDANNRKVQVHIGDSIVDISNIREIVNTSS
jgi:flagellar basal-body rod modification protein FlgD